MSLSKPLARRPHCGAAWGGPDAFCAPSIRISSAGPSVDARKAGQPGGHGPAAPHPCPSHHVPPLSPPPLSPQTFLASSGGLYCLGGGCGNVVIPGCMSLPRSPTSSALQLACLGLAAGLHGADALRAPAPSRPPRVRLGAGGDSVSPECAWVWWEVGLCADGSIQRGLDDRESQ